MDTAKINKVSSKTVIGIDFDNTLVCYDEIFHRAACEEGLIDPSVPRSKEKVRDAIRLIPNGEARWTRLQAVVYGPQMAGATLFEGVASFFGHCAEEGIAPLIVSHKTPFAMLDGTKVDLRQAALEWMNHKGFFDPAGFGMLPGKVFFESTRLEKIDRIRSVGCTHFIDDLVEVFAESAFPGDIQKMLFAPHGTKCALSGIKPFKSWHELDRFFFNDPRS
jgi:hypothetical protein